MLFNKNIGLFEGKSVSGDLQTPRNSCYERIYGISFCEYTTRRDRVTIFFCLTNRLILYKLLFNLLFPLPSCR